MTVALWSLVVFIGCGGGESAREAESCPPELTWDAFAEGYVTQWCAPCHASDLTGPERLGAPEGMDFDSFAETAALAERIAARATGPGADMPPGGGPPEAEREELARWLACGLPGGADPAEACAAPDTVTGPVHIGSAEEAAELCSGDVLVDGDLVVAAGSSIPCVCGVTGDLVASAGEVSLPVLGAVGGALRADGAALVRLEVPALASVGELVLAGGDALVAVDLGRLERVGGSVTFQDLASLGALDLGRLGAVDGDLALGAMPSLASLDLSRVGSVSGSLTLIDLPAVTELGALDSVAFVGGDLVVQGVGVTDLEPAFDSLAEVEGDVVLADLPALRGVLGLRSLLRVGGSVELRALDSLAAPGGPAGLEKIGGDLVLIELAASSVDGLEHLVSIGGDLRLENLAALTDLGAFQGSLATVGGDFVVTDAPLLSRAQLDGLVAAIELGGELVVDP